MDRPFNEAFEANAISIFGITRCSPHRRIQDREQTRDATSIRFRETDVPQEGLYTWLLYTKNRELGARARAGADQKRLGSTLQNICNMYILVLNKYSKKDLILP